MSPCAPNPRGTPSEWKPARRAQIDRDGRWTIKRGGQREAPPVNGIHDSLF